MVCNRDERRDRAAALPPTARRLRGQRAIYPMDPVGGGTWVGVNDAGLAAAVLNRTLDSKRMTGMRPSCSRGLIVPALLGHDTLDGALEAAARLAPADFDLFRLVVVHATAIGILTSDGHSFSIATVPLVRPLMLTSSSLGDDAVRPARQALFERIVTRGRRGWLNGQMRFHAHQWRTHPDISVRMERADARTVSRTVVDVRSGAIDMRYQPVAEVVSRAARRGESWPAKRRAETRRLHPTEKRSRVFSVSLSLGGQLLYASQAVSTLTTACYHPVSPLVRTA